MSALDRRSAAKARLTAALDMLTAKAPDIDERGVTCFVQHLDRECSTVALEEIAEGLMADAVTRGVHK